MSIISLQAFRNVLYEYQNLIIVFGLIISFSGGSWDITFHILSQPESFFSYPHSLVYTGIFIVISIFFINFIKNISNENPNRKANCIILLGAVLILAAGPFDFSWHLKFGLDGLLSPPHVTLLTGWMLVGLGNLRIINNLVYLNLRNRRSEKNSSVVRAEVNYQEYDRNDHEDSGTVDYANKPGKEKLALLKIQLFLNLSFILLILSGFIYFFSLPFSETQYYNYNPDPLVAFFVYSLGFPLLFSSFFLRILKNYPDFDEMILLVGSFYVVIMLLTQITSNPFLFVYSAYYMLNVIPFVIIYLLNKKQKRKTFSKMNALALPVSNSKDKTEKYMNAKMYIFYALVLAISSFTICFPLNTYILNEELYGYLVYQNLVSKVYNQLFGDYFIIIMGISIVGGLLGFSLAINNGIVKASKYKVIQFRQYFAEHRHGGR
ncbi:MAG: hypothetical protein L0H53_02570 [Candidatus Nitrosocosmicus sp.]|nr:hypothetical protein [Candidatus Nitrosocosmicus sp.]MDN5865826.1 hypothetical protein [Candidatus Nitrosocosmicus sp.]